MITGEDSKLIKQLEIALCSYTYANKSNPTAMDIIREMFGFDELTVLFRGNDVLNQITLHSQYAAYIYVYPDCIRVHKQEKDGHYDPDQLSLIEYLCEILPEDNRLNTLQSYILRLL